MLGLLLFALQDLKSTLISQGSDLILGLGSAEDILFNLVNEVTNPRFIDCFGFCYVYKARLLVLYTIASFIYTCLFSL